MKSDFKEGRCGIAFKNGKLYEFSDRHVLVLSPWPDPRAWLKRRSHNWMASRKWADSLFSMGAHLMKRKVELERPTQLGLQTLPSGQGLLPGVLSQSIEERNLVYQRRDLVTFSAFFSTFPPDVLTEVFKFSNRQWHVLNLLARCPGAADLCRSNPALLYALASNWVFHKPGVSQPIRAARGLVNRKQKQVLDWLGFPANETVRRILCKIVPDSISVESLLYLRGSLDDPFVTKSLSHIERINAGVLRLVTDLKYRSYLTPRLLEDIGCDKAQDVKNPPFFWILLDTIKMADKAVVRHCPPQFSSLKRLHDVHDELAQRLRHREIDQVLKLPAHFSPPPYAGTESIRPIMTPDELYLEGAEMHHCAASHAESVAEGHEFMYRVLTPIRATLSIISCAGRWHRGQLFMAYNKPVEHEMECGLFDMLFQSGRVKQDEVFEKDDEACLEVYDRRQLPLLPPDEMAIFWRCVNAFDVNGT